MRPTTREHRRRLQAGLPRRSSRVAPTPVKTGPRSRTWQSEDESRTGSLNATTVCIPFHLTYNKTNSLTQSTGKKLKRRLEDLERRAQSRSISPNGEDTDGRSTRESSAENAHASSVAAAAAAAAAAATSTSVHQITPPATPTYEYTTPSYTTSSSSTPYPSQYRTASSMQAYSSSASPSSTYVSAPLDYSQAPSTGYMYAPYDHHSHHQQTDLSVIDPSFHLPHPTSTSSSSRIPGVMRTGGMYDLDNSASASNTISPYFLSNPYEEYFPTGGVSSSYYNLDNLNPLPPLLNTPYSTSQRN